jgi:hypothetical protein
VRVLIPYPLESTQQVDEAFAGLSERERKKQLAMLKQLEALQGKNR